MIELNTIEEVEQLPKLITENQRILVDFAAHWCGPCKVVVGILNSLANDFEKAGVKVLKVNLDNDEMLSFAKIEHKITSIPTIFYYENGKKKQILVGGNQINAGVLKKLIQA